MIDIHPMFDVGYDLGIEHERQRIIKLLEDYDAYINRDSLIALIKGENR